MQFKRRAREEFDVNLTPLIDVVFLLLIFFMVSTTFTKETRVNIELPEADGKAGVITQAQVLEVTITSEGQYAVNGKTLRNNKAKTLRAAISREVNSDTSLPFIISADGTAPHQSVVTVMDVAGQLGFANLSITTMKPNDKK